MAQLQPQFQSARSRLEAEKPAPQGLCAHDVAHRMDLHSIQLIDIRPRGDFATQCIPGACNVPADEVATGAFASFDDSPVVLCCETGEISSRLARRLGWDRCDFLLGGLQAWKGAGLKLWELPR